MTLIYTFTYVAALSQNHIRIRNIAEMQYNIIHINNNMISIIIIYCSVCNHYWFVWIYLEFSCLQLLVNQWWILFVFQEKLVTNPEKADINCDQGLLGCVITSAESTPDTQYL